MPSETEPREILACLKPSNQSATDGRQLTATGSWTRRCASLGEEMLDQEIPERLLRVLRSAGEADKTTKTHKERQADES